MNESSIFAIFDPQGIIQGTGFLVAENLGVTCAHVVQNCGKEPGDELVIRFLDREEPTVVHVVPEYWHEAQDVAFLSLTQDTINISRLVLRAASKSINATVKGFGFPNTQTQGLYARGTVFGIIKDEHGRDLIQMDSGEITKGFSGAPVWDIPTNQVVGMVTAITPTDHLGRLDRVAFASPSETLVALHPSLALYDLASELVKGITQLPVDYGVRIKNFVIDYLDAPFGGRNADIAALDNWLTSPDAPPYAFLAGEAGRGKSALLVKWIETIKQRELAQVVFIPISLRYNTSQANVVFTSLAIRLGEIYNDPVQYVQLFAEEWKDVCSKYLERTPPDGKTLLVILDALDEATDWQAGPDLFPFRVPVGVRVLVSARYHAGDVDAKGWLRRLGWDKANRAQALSLPPLSESGVQDVLEKMGNPLDKLATQVDVVRELFRLSEGDPLLVRLYIEALLPYGENVAFIEPEDLAKIETGLKGYFDSWWADQRTQWGRDFPLREKSVSTVLNLLACALAPLTKRDILTLAPQDCGITSWTLDEALVPLRRFIVGDGKTNGYIFSHPRLGYYFYETLDTEQIQWETLFLAYGKHILETVNQRPQNLPDISPYPVQTYGAHLERAGSSANDIYGLVSEGWMRAWYRLEGIYLGYLRDVDRAWKRAEVEKNIAIQIKCALVKASVATSTSTLPVEIYELAIICNQITPLHGWKLGLSAPLDWQFSGLLHLLNYLPLEEIENALIYILNLYSKFEIYIPGPALTNYTELLAPILQNLPRDVLPIIFEYLPILESNGPLLFVVEELIKRDDFDKDLLYYCTENLQEPYKRIRSLLLIINQLSQSCQYLAQRLMVNSWIEGSENLYSALGEFFLFLNSGLKNEVIKLLDSFEEKTQLSIYIYILNDLPSEEKSRIISLCLDTILLHQFDEYEKLNAIEYLFKHLNQTQLQALISKSLPSLSLFGQIRLLIMTIPLLNRLDRESASTKLIEIAKQSQNDYLLNNTVEMFIENPGDDDLSFLIDLINLINNQESRVKLLFNLRTKLSGSDLEYANRLIETTRSSYLNKVKLDEYEDRLEKLISSKSYANIDELMGVCISMLEVYGRIQSIQMLVDQLQDDQKVTIFKKILRIANKQSRLMGLSMMIPQLPQDSQTDVIEDIRRLDDYDHQVASFALLIPDMPIDGHQKLLNILDNFPPRNYSDLLGVLFYYSNDINFKLDCYEKAKSIKDNDDRKSLLIDMLFMLPQSKLVVELPLIMNDYVEGINGIEAQAEFFLSIANSMTAKEKRKYIELAIMRLINGKFDEFSEFRRIIPLLSKQISEIPKHEKLEIIEFILSNEKLTSNEGLVFELLPFLDNNTFKSLLPTLVNRNPAFMGRCIARILNNSKVRVPTSVVRKVIEVTKSIKELDKKFEIFSGLSDHLSDKLKNELITWANSLPDVFSRYGILINLLPFPLNKNNSLILSEILSFINSSEISDKEKFRQVTSILPHLSPEFSDEGINILKRCAPQGFDPEKFSEMFSKLQRKESIDVFEIIGTIKESYKVPNAIRLLFPILSIEEQKEAIKILFDSTSAHSIPSPLVDASASLHKENFDFLIEEIKKSKDENLKALSLIGCSTQFPSEFHDRILNVLSELSDSAIQYAIFNFHGLKATWLMRSLLPRIMDIPENFSLDGGIETYFYRIAGLPDGDLVSNYPEFIKYALNLALTIRPGRFHTDNARPEALSIITPLLVKLSEFDRARSYKNLANAIRILSGNPRTELLRDLSAILPWILSLENLDDILIEEAISDVLNWNFGIHF